MTDAKLRKENEMHKVMVTKKKNKAYIIAQ